MTKRLQVDIKPHHQPVVREIQEKLGNVSSSDAISFLIETQKAAALARLEPNFVPTFNQSATKSNTESPQFDTKRNNDETVSHANHRKNQQKVAANFQAVTDSYTQQQDVASDALDQLLSA